MPTISTTGRLLAHAMQRRLLVKFVRAGRMLQWISHHFEIRGIVFIVRHPCAVVSSMLEHGAWSSVDASGETLENYLGGALPLPLRDEICNRLSYLPRTPAEQLAFLWTLDHYIPFHHFERHGYPWTLVSYEAILQGGAGELERIFNALGSDVPQAAYNHLMEASNSASRDLQMQNVQRQLSKWTRKLDADQVERILRIAESFDLDFYSSDVEPDYELLSQYQSTEEP